MKTGSEKATAQVTKMAMPFPESRNVRMALMVSQSNLGGDISRLENSVTERLLVSFLRPWTRAFMGGGIGSGAP